MELHPLPITQPPIPKYRGLIRAQVSSCTRCNLRQECRQPVPYEGPTGAPFVALGEAPGRVEDEKIRPFVGPAGKLLRALINDAGFDSSTVFYMNAASCAPLDGKSVRAPKEPELQACRDNLLSQLKLANSRFVLICGATALKAFRHDLSVSEVHGEVFLWMDTWLVMPIFHPAAILRDKALKKPTQEDMGLWYDIITSGEDIRNWFGHACIRCRGAGEYYDRDGVPYCKTHYEKYGGNWEKSRKKWGKYHGEQLRIE